MDFVIKLLLDRAQADQMSNAELLKLQKVVSAHEKLAQKAQAAAERRAAAADKAAERAVKALERESAAAERGAQRAQAALDRQTTAAQRAADRRAAAAEKAAQRSAAADDRAAQRAQVAAQRKADAEVRATERAAAADQRRADRAEAIQARSAQRAQDRAIQQQQDLIRGISTRGGLAPGERPGLGNLFGATTAGVGGIATAGAAAGLAALTETLGAVADAARRASERQRDLAGEFARERDTLREVASMMGKQANAEFVLAQARERTITGLTAAEQRTFQTELLGAGQQQIGRNISPEEFQKFQTLVQQQAAVSGIGDVGTYGQLAGTILGSRNYNRFGAQAGRTAASETNVAFKLVQEGVGKNPVLAQNMAKGVAALQSEKEFMGIFQGAPETAIAISAMAEAHPDDPETFVRAGIRALYNTGGKQAPLLKRAGITPQMGYFERFRRVSDVLATEAQQRKVPVQAILPDYFSHEQARGAIAGMMEKGNAAVEKRREKQRLLEKPGAMETMLGEAYQDPTGALQDRLAERQGELADLEQGEETAVLETYRKRAQAEVRRADRQAPGGVWGVGVLRSLKDSTRLSHMAGTIGSYLPFVGGALGKLTEGIPGEEEREVQVTMIRQMAERLAKHQGGQLTGEQRAQFQGAAVAAREGLLGPGMFEQTLGPLAKALADAGIAPGAAPQNLQEVSDPKVLRVLEQIRDQLAGPPVAGVAAPAPPGPLAPLRRPAGNAAVF